VAIVLRAFFQQSDIQAKVNRYLLVLATWVSSGVIENQLGQSCGVLSVA